MARSLRPKTIAFLVVGVPLIVFGVALLTFIIGAAAISSHINANREVRTCTVEQVLAAGQGGGRRLEDGKPSWLIKTDCGGTLYIDPDATHQTAAEATQLQESLQPAVRYHLTIQGQLGNRWTISSYLLAAAPAD